MNKPTHELSSASPGLAARRVTDHPRRRTLLISAVAGLLSACSDDGRPALADPSPPSRFGTVQIADLDEALTFARFERDGRRRVLAVSRYQAGTVDGVDLTAALGAEVDDPVSVFLERGYDGLRDAIRGADPSAKVSIAVAELDLPIDFPGHHIAVGTNFPEHADDAGTTHPFLFPKLVRPTASTAPVSAGPGLLDYEVELAFVPLEPLVPGRRPASMGLILCNDFTDREALMRGIDPYDVESGKGFTTGKSFPGSLPVGDLFVLPRDFRAFADQLELRLFVNGELRQRGPTREMVWDIDEILAQTWARRGVRWEHLGQQVSLPGDSASIPARTIILSGTPRGTVFSGLSTWHTAEGVLRWLFGGWSRSIPEQVIAAHVDAAHRARTYLQPGDRVWIQVDRLGGLHNRVLP